MKSLPWRSLAEIIGVVSIVVGLILVALEIRQSNNIAKAEIVFNLAEQYNQFNTARFENSEVAQLSLMMQNPDDFEIAEIDASRIAGAAWHFANILWSSQIAYDNGLLGLDELTNYQSQMAWLLEYMPAMANEFVLMWNSSTAMHNTIVFRPLEYYVENLTEYSDGQP